jgi:phosphoribosyl 1,2-cyclic phosphodiesterase
MGGSGTPVPESAAVRFAVLASGSGGNSCYVEGPGGAILVDAGLSARETARRVSAAGGDMERVRAILVTHEHGDHVAGARVLARRLDVPVFATEGTLDAAPEEIPGASPIEPGREFCAGGFSVLPFPLPHDAAEPVGFVLSCGPVTLGYATDLGYPTALARERLSRCDAVVLESNHDERMLMEGPYPWHLKMRIRGRRGHLSNPASAGLLADLMHPGLRAVVLAHLSETNNLPDLALGCAREALGRGRGTGLFAACAAAPMPMFTIDW